MQLLMVVLVMVVLATPLSFAAQEQDTDTAPYELPLTPDRHLSISTDAVTWLAVDASPDGETLVLEMLGDLYLLPVTGGAATALTSDMAFDTQAVFSPDGTKLAFISDRAGHEDVWVMDLEDRSMRALSKSGPRVEMTSPSWSADGNHVVVSRATFEQRTYELWTYDLEGGTTGVSLTTARPKPDTPSALRDNALGGVFDPSGRYLYYANKKGGFGYNAQFPMWQIVRKDLVTGQVDALTGRVGSAVRPQLSPDGTLLTYATRYEHQTGLRIRNLKTNVDTWLAYPVQRDEQESRFTRDLLPQYSFNAAGDGVWFTKGGKLHLVNVETKDIEEIPFTIDAKVAVADRLEFPWRVETGDVENRILAEMSISPDGNKVAFGAFGRVYTANTDGSGVKQLSAEAGIAAQPAWSPDGRELVYVTWDGRQGQLYRQRARGGKARLVTQQTGAWLDPVWSPDGNSVYAIVGSDYERAQRESVIGPGVDANLVRIDARSGEVEVVRAAKGLSEPHFGPDEERIYLHHDSPLPNDKSAGLVSFRLDGSDQRTHVRVEGTGYYSQNNMVGAQTMHLSPDGRHVAIQQADQLYVTRLVPHLTNQKVVLSKPSQALIQLTDVGVDYLDWSADGQLFWTAGNTLYQRTTDSLDFSAAEQAGSEEEDGADSAEGEQEADAEPLKEADERVKLALIEVSRPRHGAKGTLALLNATVIPVDGPVIEQGAVIIEDDRIAAVGKADEIDIPAGAQRIDLQGKFIAPGYVDTHAHFRVSRQVPEPVSWSLLANLAYGVTMGMDVQPSTVDLLIVQDMVDAGLMVGPRAYSTGPGVFNNNEFKSKAHAHAVLKRYKDHYRVHNLKAYISGARNQRHWMIEAARDLELNPTTEGALDMKLDLTHAIDGFTGLEHAYPTPVLYKDVVELTAQTRMAYTPTLLVAYGGPWAENYFYTNESPHDDPRLRRFTPYEFLSRRTLRRQWFHPREYITDTIAASALKVVEAGGQVGVGAHGQLQGLGYHWELWSLAAGGYSNAEALEAATLMGAQMLGVSQDLGSITVGKLADLVVLDANPLQNIRNTARVSQVMKGGELFEAETLKQVWPQEKELPPFWWQSLTPEAQLPGE